MRSENIRLIFPKNDSIKVTGSIYYGESVGAWNLIRLKREVLQEFPQLKRRREKFGYSMNIHRNFNSLKKEINRLEKENKEVVPILLFFGKLKE